MRGPLTRGHLNIPMTFVLPFSPAERCGPTSRRRAGKPTTGRRPHE